MANLQVDCIVKRDRTSPFERIHAIGGPLPVTAGLPVAGLLSGGETRWQKNEDVAISELSLRTNTFYTNEGGVRANVRIGKRTTETGGTHYYLTTEPDGYPPNNLLKLTDPCRKA